MQHRLEGRAAVITGAANGIGRSTTELFASEGATVFAVDVRPEVTTTFAGCPGLHPLCCDLTDPGAIDSLIEQVGLVAGRLDVLCNVAGIIDGFALLDETSNEVWNRVVAINLTAPFLLTRAAMPWLLRQGGAVVNIGSMAGVKGLPGPSYAATKAGLIGFTRSTALEFGAQGVRCNIINPGHMNTDIGLNSGGYSERGRAHLSKLIGTIPVMIGGAAADVAQAALWLATDDARFVNGAVLAVDGGFSAA